MSSYLNLKPNHMDYRTIYHHEVELKYKKGKSFLTKYSKVVTVCKTAIEMNNTPRVIRTFQAEIFGQKSAAYKSGVTNLWVTKIIKSIDVGQSFHYNDVNYKQ